MRTPTRPKNDNPVIDRIDLLLKTQYKTQKELISYLGLCNATYTRWRYENSRSYMDHIEEIADFFGVSINYLLQGNIKMLDDDREVGVETLGADEIELIMNLRAMDIEKRMVIYKMARWLRGE